MSSLSDTSLQIIQQLESYAHDQLPQAEADKFSRFIYLYFSQMPLIDLVSRSMPDLYGTVFSHWQLMQHRAPGELKIHIFNPQFEEYGWQSTHTIIQVITDDMPFLVDTIRMEMNRLQLTTHLMIFCGGVKVQRDVNNNLVNIFSYHSSDCENCINEAPVQFEIDRQTNPSVLNEIRQNLIRVLNDVRAAVEDWKIMGAQLQECINQLDEACKKNETADIRESKNFLEWLLNNHFTFLGYRHYTVVGEGRERALVLVKGSGLGVLRDDSKSKVLRSFTDLPEAARELVLSQDQVLIISKTNTLSTVHRPAYTDYIGVKQFNEQGVLIGERRFIGLYTSEAYRMDPRSIPFIRLKVSSVVKMSKLPLHSHAGKDLIHIISTLPRDDLFHASTDELFELANGILHMQERRCTRLFIRKDAYNRFISCLLYLPRENLNSAHILQIERLFKQIFCAIDITHTTYVSESILARVHYVVRVNPRQPCPYNTDEIEQTIIKITKSWQDELYQEVLAYFGEERGNELILKYRYAFPAGYREVFQARPAVFDIENIEALGVDGRSLKMTFYRPLGASKEILRFKLYHPHQTIPLSDIIPMLENLGLRVIGEQPYQIIFQDGSQVWINDFGMIYDADQAIEVERIKDTFQEAFLAIWRGDAEDDQFNRLVLVAQLSWREISMLRAYTKYFRQIGVVFSEQYIANILVKHHVICTLLVHFFKCGFDPSVSRNNGSKQEIIAKIEAELDKVTALSEDRTLRLFLTLIKATYRTNYFQLDDEGNHKPYLSFKLNPKKLPDLPLPIPKYEIFVYSPRFEGIHLRSTKVSRGGIRWSDRHEDFRTEILGLMKAQQVKNALIVPAGAKGGFVTKRLQINSKREEILQEGIACYENFIRGLLDVTDNIVNDEVIPQPYTICYDKQDPYLVVAADKGTATFSDIANRISEERNYWLGDAFASGGSTGYDHKKMGITARGAWISGERHFQNLGINVDSSEITVVGIGDMSGDVFGNGMLLSKHLKLVAAFNHMHIFLDPNPDPLLSFAERKRLFELPRSTWDDYDKALISKGGGVYSRFLKAIVISPEVAELLKLEQRLVEPNELIKAILKAEVDLLWNGGIGTYVKSSTQHNDTVGDRSNDAIRIDGKDLKVRVICEGGNLGLTQLGRIEYELNGGSCNTDFIDNSAGVDCSDHEVNIKILLNSIVAAGHMTVKQRNELLATMSDEIAGLVLQDNYQQNRVISLNFHYSSKMLLLFVRFIQAQEKANKLNRTLEFIADDKSILERRSSGKGLTRPELSVLLAYSKIILKAELLKTDAVQDPYLRGMIKHAFPAVLNQHYHEAMQSHYLAREIIATQISNQMVSDMGITFAFQMQDEMGVSIDQIVKTYAAARVIFDLESYYADIESLDYLVDVELQYKIMHEGLRVVRRAVRWFLRNRRENFNIARNIEDFSCHVKDILERLPKLMLGASKERFDADVLSYVEHKVPEDTAIRAASMARLYHALNIIEAASNNNVEVFRVAKIYFMLVDRLDLLWFRDQINNYPITNRWSILAKSAYKGDLDWVQRALTVGVLHGASRSIPGKINDWFVRHHEAIERWKSIMSDMRSSEVIDFALLFVALRELIDLAEISEKSSDREVNIDE